MPDHPSDITYLDRRISGYFSLNRNREVVRRFRPVIRVQRVDVASRGIAVHTREKWLRKRWGGGRKRSAVAVTANAEHARRIHVAIARALSGLAGTKACYCLDQADAKQRNQYEIYSVQTAVD